MAKEVFETCTEHAACVVSTTEQGVVTHHRAEERVGSVGPPPRLTGLTHAEATRIWDSLESFERTLTRSLDAVRREFAAGLETERTLAKVTFPSTDRVGALERVVQTIQTKIRELESDIEATTPDVNAGDLIPLEVRIEQVNEVLQAVRASAAVKEVVEGLAARVEALEGHLAARKSPVQPEELALVRDGLAEQVGEVRKGLTLAASKDSLDEFVLLLNARLSEMERRVEDLAGPAPSDVGVLDQLWELKSTVASHAEDISHLKDA